MYRLSDRSSAFGPPEGGSSTSKIPTGVIRKTALDLRKIENACAEFDPISTFDPFGSIDFHPLPTGLPQLFLAVTTHFREVRVENVFPESRK